MPRRFRVSESERKRRAAAQRFVRRPRSRPPDERDTSRRSAASALASFAAPGNTTARSNAGRDFSTGCRSRDCQSTRASSCKAWTPSDSGVESRTPTVERCVAGASNGDLFASTDAMATGILPGRARTSASRCPRRWVSGGIRRPASRQPALASAYDRATARFERLADRAAVGDEWSFDNNNTT